MADKPKDKIPLWKQVWTTPHVEYARPKSYQELYEMALTSAGRNKLHAERWRNTLRKSNEDWAERYAVQDDKSWLLKHMYPQEFYVRPQLPTEVMAQGISFGADQEWKSRDLTEQQRIADSFKAGTGRRQRPQPLSRNSKLADRLLGPEYDFPHKEREGIAEGLRIAAAKKAAKEMAKQVKEDSDIFKLWLPLRKK